jgi:hypothetical protein
VNTLHVRVGGVTFRVRCADERLVGVLRPSFDPFLDDTHGADEDIDVELEVEGECAPPVDGSRLELEQHDGGALVLRGPSTSAQISADNGRAHYRGPPHGQPVHALLRLLLARALLERGALLVHASAVIDDAGHAALFVGASGAGKTTVAATLPGVVAADEAVVLTHHDGRAAVAGTPWWTGHPVTAPLKTLVFLARGAARSFETVGHARATARLVGACGPLPANDAAATLDVAADLVERAPRVAQAVLATREDILDFLQPRLREPSEA